MVVGGRRAVLNHVIWNVNEVYSFLFTGISFGRQNAWCMTELLICSVTYSRTIKSVFLQRKVFFFFAIRMSDDDDDCCGQIKPKKNFFVPVLLWLN